MPGRDEGTPEKEQGDDDDALQTLVSDSPDLEDLVVESGYDTNALAEALEPYVRFGSEQGEVLLQDQFHELGPTAQVLVGLLVHSARYELGYEGRRWISGTRLAQQVQCNVSDVNRATEVLTNMEDIDIERNGTGMLALGYGTSEDTIEHLD